MNRYNNCPQKHERKNMNIDLKEADEKELMAYQIALLNIQVSINKQLSIITNKLKEKEKNDK
tara:strand:- start:221 stop:406 length:186 start_codon:yes stop_codon:yes gene_type:complete